MAYSIKESVKKYKKQEKEYAELISIFGEVSFSNEKEDMFEHWDVKLDTGDSVILTDVKAMRKVNRSDESPDERYHYVELKNVNGNDGWLYGKADCFAFEMENQYVVVNKDSLQKLISEKCKDKIHSDKPSLYKLYSRPGRNDLIVLVDTNDLINISRRIVFKTKIDLMIKNLV